MFVSLLLWRKPHTAARAQIPPFCPEFLAMACFGRLGELRSLAPDKTPVMALTATATKETRQQIINVLNLKDNLHLIVDRSNIYLYVVK